MAEPRASCCVILNTDREESIMQEIQSNIAKNLRRAMQSRNRTLLEFSEELSVSRTAMRKYLRGEANPTVDTLAVIAAKLEMTPGELVSDLPRGLGQAETMLQASKEMAALPLERQEIAVRLILELAALFAD